MKFTLNFNLELNPIFFFLHLTYNKKGGLPLDILIQAVISGILIGGVYALISVGLSIVFGVMEIVNFAQAEFLMLGMFGAFIGWQYLNVDPLLFAIIVGLIVFGLGALLERILIEPIINAPQLSQVFVTIGLSIVLKNGAAVLFGNDYNSVQTSYQTSVVKLGQYDLSVPYLIAFGFALIATVLLHMFLQHTNFGRAMRATSQNRMSAELLGINPKVVYMVAFGLGVGLTAFSGAVILPYTTVFPTVGEQYVLIMFTIVVLGGLSSIRGVVIAGLLIGIIQSTSSVYFPFELQNLVVFIIFFAALVFIRGGVLKRVRIRT
jgi:branched-chain amino acid transport system permease protein